MENSRPGSNISELRQKSGLSRDNFACKADVAYAILTKIETGIVKKP
jgi:DNA-binding transcriptional regulator YiaG